MGVAQTLSNDNNTYITRLTETLTFNYEQVL